MKEKRKTGCEAPQHNQGCPCLSCTTRDCQRCPLLTKDHFTPKSIALRVLGWKHRQVNRPENIQWLTEPCHIDKDRTTQKRFQQLQLQVGGRFIGLGEHIT